MGGEAELQAGEGNEQGECGGSDEYGGQRPGVIPAAAVAVGGGGDQPEGEAAAGFF